MDILISRSGNFEVIYGAKVKNIKNRLPEVLANPVVKEFLENESNSKAFYKVLDYPNTENINLLDRKFKDFYRYNRIIRYLTGLIKRYSIDYDKRVKLRNNRYPLIMDKPINGTGYSAKSMVEMFSDTKQITVDYSVLKEDEPFYIENEFLYKAIQKLNSKQWIILFLFYEKGFNNKNISQLFGQTEQNISYWHKKTLKQLKETFQDFKGGELSEKRRSKRN